MADTTLPGVLLKGVAGSRPSASAVAKGTIYSATDTGAITQSDGVSTWSTYATISSGLADPMTTRGDIIVRNSSNATARLAIGSSGKVLSSDGTDISWQTPAGSTPAFVGASATHNTTQSITTATVTVVALNTENFDSSTLHDTVTNNNRITVATTGKYQVNAGVQWASNTSGQRILGIRKNGTTVKEVEQNFAVAAIDGHSQSVSMIVSLASTDYVEMVVYQTSGGNLNLQSGQGLPLLDVGLLGT